MKRIISLLMVGMFAAISPATAQDVEEPLGEEAAVRQQPDDPIQLRRVPDSMIEAKLSFAPLVGHAAPAVVNIYTRKIVQTRRSSMLDDPMFKRFFGDKFSFGAPQKRVQGSLGSGVIVRSSGVIVTNNHVIDGADQITVVLSDRREFEATLILADARTDLAILKITPNEDDNLATLSLSDSDDILVGDMVLAIGNPFGVGQTVTSGIVSGTARTQKGISDLGFFIQTDAAINPGNSGGALVSMDGTLLGINSAIYSRSGGSNGIGFAIPANMVRTVLRAALDEGELARPWLGIRGQSVTAELADGLGLTRPGGVLVDMVWPESPADYAGIRSGDVVMGVDGREVIDKGGLNYRVATQEEDAIVPVSILRDGEMVSLDVPLALPPESPLRAITLLDGRHPFQGVSVGNLSPRFNEELKIDPFVSGVMVLRLTRRTPAARYQFLHAGDLLLEINGQTINQVADVEAALDDSAEEYLYRINRRGILQDCIIIPNQSYRCRQAGR